MIRSRWPRQSRPARGSGVPTGTVSFLAFGIPLGSAVLAPVSGVPTASVTVPLWLLGKGTSTVDAYYSGDAAFSSSFNSVRVQVTLPTAANVAAIVSVRCGESGAQRSLSP